MKLDFTGTGRAQVLADEVLRKSIADGICPSAVVPAGPLAFGVQLAARVAFHSGLRLVSLIII